MAVVSCYTDLRHLQADCVHEQSKILQGLSTDIQYAVGILNYKVYDMDKQSLAMRKAAFEAASKHECEGGPLANWQTEEEERQAKKLISSNALMLEAAEQVKIGLKTLIEIVCADPKAGPFSSSTDLLEENIEIDSDTATFPKTTLTTPPLEDQLASELNQARRICVDSSQFIPVNFQALSTPIHCRVKAINYEMEKPKPIQNLRVIDDAAMSKCQEATKALSAIMQSPRGRGRPKGSKNKPRVSRLELSDGIITSKKEKGVEWSQSPPGASNVNKTEKELFSWIPPKIEVSPISSDGKMRELLVDGTKSMQGRLEY